MGVRKWWDSQKKTQKNIIKRGPQNGQNGGRGNRQIFWGPQYDPNIVVDLLDPNPHQQCSHPIKPETPTKSPQPRRAPAFAS